jgi:hypothetical protein
MFGLFCRQDAGKNRLKGETKKEVMKRMWKEKGQSGYVTRTALEMGIEKLKQLVGTEREATSIVGLTATMTSCQVASLQVAIWTTASPVQIFMKLRSSIIA